MRITGRPGYRLDDGDKLEAGIRTVGALAHEFFHWVQNGFAEKAMNTESNGESPDQIGSMLHMARRWQSYAFRNMSPQQRSASQGNFGLSDYLLFWHETASHNLQKLVYDDLGNTFIVTRDDQSRSRFSGQWFEVSGAPAVEGPRTDGSFGLRLISKPFEEEQQP